MASQVQIFLFDPEIMRLINTEKTVHSGYVKKSVGGVEERMRTPGRKWNDGDSHSTGISQNARKSHSKRFEHARDENLAAIGVIGGADTTDGGHMNRTEHEL